MSGLAIVFGLAAVGGIVGAVRYFMYGNVMPAALLSGAAQGALLGAVLGGGIVWLIDGDDVETQSTQAEL